MLTLNNITKSFPGKNQPLIHDLHLEIPKGQFCVLIGNNGSGKSTLLKLIAGEHPIDSGTILLHGKQVTIQERHKAIAAVIQDVNKGTIPEMTLLENMMLSRLRTHKAQLRFYRRRENHCRDQLTLLGLGLESYCHRPLSDLSGGQRQAVATLMAIESQPQILLLDEHTSALDPAMQSHVMAYTEQAINQNGITSIMITHNLEDALQYGHRLIMLHHSKIVLDISGDEKRHLTVSTLLNMFQRNEVRHGH